MTLKSRLRRSTLASMLAPIKNSWNGLPVRVRWIACWPALAGIYLLTFQISAITSDVMLLTVLGLDWSRAGVVLPILADIIHMALLLPAMRLLIPSHQHIFILGFASIVGFATIMAGRQLMLDLPEIMSQTPATLWISDTAALEDWPWRSSRDFINCLIVLIIPAAYGFRLWRQKSTTDA